MPPLTFEVFSLFPEVFEPYLQSSILQRARQRGLVQTNLHNIRDWTYDRHHVCDDMPYGGGGGMVMKAEPIFAAVEGVLGAPPACPVIFMSPQGRTFNQKVATELVERAIHMHDGRLALLCGRYEGIDERVVEHLVTEELSIGDFVLTGGELAALVVMDAMARLIPGVLGDPDGALDDSHASGLLEYPHYTRPPEFRGWRVPEVLLSGNHPLVGRWRREQALRRTWLRRPDLLDTAPLNESDRQMLARIKLEHSQ